MIQCPSMNWKWLTYSLPLPVTLHDKQTTSLDIANICMHLQIAVLKPDLCVICSTLVIVCCSIRQCETPLFLWQLWITVHRITLERPPLWRSGAVCSFVSILVWPFCCHLGNNYLVPWNKRSNSYGCDVSNKTVSGPNRLKPHDNLIVYIIIWRLYIINIIIGES